jgi:two-component sensor histidine kinase
MAIPLALIVNELVTNVVSTSALLPNQFALEGKALKLTISDTGHGPPQVNRPGVGDAHC